MANQIDILNTTWTIRYSCIESQTIDCTWLKVVSLKSGPCDIQDSLTKNLKATQQISKQRSRLSLDYHEYTKKKKH